MKSRSSERRGSEGRECVGSEEMYEKLVKGEYGK